MLLYLILHICARNIGMLCDMLSCAECPEAAFPCPMIETETKLQISNMYDWSSFKSAFWADTCAADVSHEAEMVLVIVARWTTVMFEGLPSLFLK